MADRELKRLNRKELLELLIEQEKENVKLRDEAEKLKSALKNRTVQIEKTGSLAEAALALNGVFEAADAAARQYLDNVKSSAGQNEKLREKIISDAEKKADAILADAEKKAASTLQKAQKKADAVVDKAKAKAADITAKAKQKAADKAYAEKVKRTPGSVKTEDKVNETE